ncbi:helix-turn-helix domain-containing protein [Caballeronia sp. LP006]|uniref:helix-turn-helix domain-containing protein n=1 Tax=unclassified Caballeronia TaxID=2646786 RepID=UPI001FD4E4AE|nr:MULTISPECIES: helix-turn-helix domain-containing protein [unclassified Caballeronia]MDR5774417.1 helix-turn-helix domain-containing protein [Caballeronia sp. LZ002]MDR5805948.1 helix-turn-helix domain-containing protein [Caballeronia sp. LZ001]MDR5826401.1 helix-turn-helix domain-containing protein [Caballeronia sp. LP006]MDR5849852.1 helix-turn-helix domain-containing protein [Caballeronia sp. LZ003]
MSTACGCHVPVIKIENYEYGAHVKSMDFHFAPLEVMKSTLPYPHRHDFYHIAWVVTGTGHHVIDSVRYEVRPQSLFFMAPGQIHDFVLSPDTVGWSISFSSEFFSFRVQNRHSETEVPVHDFDQLAAAVYLNDAQAHEMMRLIDGMMDEYRSELHGHQDAIWAYLRIFLLKAARMSSAAAVTESGTSRNVLLSRRFKSLLEKHFRSMNDAADYARLLNVTERALNEATRAALGSTAAKLIRERVMLEAKRLLLHSEVNVAEIASQLSFDDPAYFSRCFRKHTGRSPIDYRRSLDKLHI